MKKSIFLMAALLVLAGCSTINSLPYSSSVDNVVSIQQITKKTETEVALGEFTFADSVNRELTCRLVGPVKVQPEDMSEYIQKAMQEELFRAGAYSPTSQKIITGEITELDFSSGLSDAHWLIGLTLTRNNVSYNTRIKRPFTSSFAGGIACYNTANAFGGAVQQLIKEAVANPKFAELVK